MARRESDHEDVVAARLAYERAPAHKKAEALKALRRVVLAPMPAVCPPGRPKAAAEPGNKRPTRWDYAPPPDLTGVKWGGNEVVGPSEGRTLTQRGRHWDVRCVQCGAVRVYTSARINHCRELGIGKHGCAKCSGAKRSVKDRYCRSCGLELGKEDMPRRCVACDRMGHRSGWRPDGHPIVTRYRAGKRSRAALAQEAAARALAGLFGALFVSASGEKGPAL